MSNKKQWLIVAYLFILVYTLTATAQNSRIKCYFNHPVNNALSTGTNAVDVGAKFPDTIAAYINKAKYTLDFAIYNYSSNGSDGVAKIATAVNNAYARGVLVRWINDSSSNNTGLSLLNSAIPRLSSPVVSGYIMHNKFLVIDVNSPDSNDAHVITGSYNYTVQQTATDYNNLIIVQDQKVANAYYGQFNQMWGGTGNLPDTTKSLFGTHKKTSPVHYFNVGGTKVQVHFSPKDSCNKYLTAVVNSANNDLSFGIYAFTDNTIANAILNRYNAKVNVRGIVDGFSKSYKPYTTLAPLGNNMVLYTGSGLYHSKIMIADALMPSSDPQVATGSFNWSSSATNSNDENLIIIHDSSITNQYYQSICNAITVNGGNACIYPLPLNFVSFNGNINSDNAAALSWIITDAVNNNHFEIEHSTDGINFERVGTVADALNKGVAAIYHFVDKDAKDGSSFYRIKQVDNDGNFTYSKVVSLYLRTASSIKIFPNPASSILQVVLPLNAISVTVYDAASKKVLQLDVRQKFSVQLDIARMAQGKYYLEIATLNNKVVKNFVKL